MDQTGTPEAMADGRMERVNFINLDAPANELLRSLDKDERLIPYGGANFGMPLELIEPAGSRIVPTDRFFIRSNGPVPLVDAVSWRLQIRGEIEQPSSFSLDDLRALPARRLEAFLECAGNGRTRFDPLPPGTPWRNDAVGNAVWDGVALADVLAQVGVCPGAVDVVTQGADFPEMRRGLPLPVALDPRTLLAWGMNGEPLPVAHGGPVRLLVPGWAGIASTKWLVGLEVMNRPFDGFWNTDNYVFWDEQGNPLRPIAEMPPKSVIVSPADGGEITPGAVIISGWAWSGFGAVEQVEVSVDAGQTWCAAMLQPGERTGWRRWATRWEATPGSHRIQARATDERRLRQPREAPWNAKGYQMNAIQEIVVRVSA
jgi:DMSO/TMAO reductase YedYZ molybdopterin-dependent catalytic subunit